MTTARSMMIAFCLFALAMPLPTLAQDEPPPPPPPGAGGADPADDPWPMEGPDAGVPGPRLRENIERMLKRSERESRVLKEGLEMLDRGESPEKVRDHLRETIRDTMRDRAQQFRDARRPMPPPGGGARPPIGPGGIDRPPPPGPGPMAGQPPMRGPMDRLMGMLRETNPKAAERLERLRHENPEKFQRMFDEFAPRLARLVEERERNPDRWPDRVKQLLLQQRANELARKVATLPPAKQDEPRTLLRRNLEEQFDIRLKFAKEDLVQNKANAERLQREIEEKSKDRAGTIEKHMQEMIERAGHATPPEEGEPPEPPPPPGGAPGVF